MKTIKKFNYCGNRCEIKLESRASSDMIRYHLFENDVKIDTMIKRYLCPKAVDNIILSYTMKIDDAQYKQPNKQ